MALLKYGPLVAAASGTIGGTVFSHNRGGAYARRWAKPHVVGSEEARQAKAILSAVSRMWATLTDAQQQAWAHKAIENPIVNRIGESHTLAGHQLYYALNSRLILAGQTPINVPPMVAPPNPIGITSLTCDISDTKAEIVFTTTPLPAQTRLWVWACLVDSPGIEFVGNRLRLVAQSATAQASPYDFYAELLARFGTIQADQVCHVAVQTLDETYGQVSGFAIKKATFTS